MVSSRIAVVAEDDSDVRDLIEMVLTQSGFKVILAPDGYSALQAVREHSPIITTLDINMPGIDGFAVAKRLREFSETYLVMITSLDEEVDIIRGFEAGADDYLVKPFRPRELRARADAMLRRVGYVGPLGPGEGSAVRPPEPEPESWAAAAVRELKVKSGGTTPTPAPGTVPGLYVVSGEPDTQKPAGAPTPARAQAPTPARAPAPTPPAATPAAEPSRPTPPAAVAAAPAADKSPVHASGDVLTFQDLAVNAMTGAVVLHGKSLELTKPETDLLVSLMKTGRRVRSKADLVLTLRPPDQASRFVNEADKRTVDAHMTTLRSKLGDQSQRAQYIETVKGVGYRLAPVAA